MSAYLRWKGVSGVVTLQRVRERETERGEYRNEEKAKEQTGCIV